LDKSSDDKFYICTGGGGGIMEAANKGASDVGEPTIGLNILLPFEQSPNEYISNDLLLQVHYFFI
jgi:predicted Rossmann-fold nucleotide-binding protein